MLSTSPAEYRAILRNDFASFADRCFQQLHPGVRFTRGWHIELIAGELAGLRTASRQLIVNLPPRHLKSLLGSVALPAWLLGHNPSRQIICASYGSELADKLSRDCRAVMQSTWYQATFATRLNRIAVNELTTTKHGTRMATSVDGVLTGRGAEMIIIDDPLKPDEALSDTTRARVNGWFDNTLYSRLNDKRTGSILLTMQRLHEEDLTGHLLSQAQGTWDHLVLLAIAEQDEHYHQSPEPDAVGDAQGRGGAHPAREPLEVLEKVRQTIGEYNFAGQYQQTPAPRDGGIVKRGWFKSYGPRDLPDRFELVVQSWDTANKPTELSDYSVCTTWGVAGNRNYLLYVLRKKLDYPSLKRAVREQAEVYNADVVLVENKASGTQLIQELGQERMSSVRAYELEPGLNKLMRLHAQTGVIENGFVFLPDVAEWLDAYVHELITFPAGQHDDQVDSTSQALHWIKLGQPKTPGIILWQEQQIAKLRRQGHNI